MASKNNLSASEALAIIDAQQIPENEDVDLNNFGDDVEEEGIGIEMDDVTVELDIHDASERGDLVEVELFLRLSSDPNVGNEHKTTPLMKACIGGSLEVAECLVRAGADLDAKNEWGNTALHYACTNSHMHLIRFLLDRGADPDIENDYGSRPWDDLVELNKWQRQDAEEMLTRASLLKRSEFRAQAERVEGSASASAVSTPLKSTGPTHSASPAFLQDPSHPPLGQSLAASSSSVVVRNRSKTPVLRRHLLPEVQPPPRARSADRAATYNKSLASSSPGLFLEARRLSDPDASVSKSQKKTTKVFKWMKDKLRRGPSSSLSQPSELPPPHSSSPSSDKGFKVRPLSFDVGTANSQQESTRQIEDLQAFSRPSLIFQQQKDALGTEAVNENLETKMNSTYVSQQDNHKQQQNVHHIPPVRSDTGFTDLVDVPAPSDDTGGSTFSSSRSNSKSLPEMNKDV